MRFMEATPLHRQSIGPRRPSNFINFMQIHLNSQKSEKWTLLKTVEAIQLHIHSFELSERWPSFT